VQLCFASEVTDEHAMIAILLWEEVLYLAVSFLPTPSQSHAIKCGTSVLGFGPLVNGKSPLARYTSVQVLDHLTFTLTILQEYYRHVQRFCAVHEE
jgi:hypothetical protein